MGIFGGFFGGGGGDDSGGSDSGGGDSGGDTGSSGGTGSAAGGGYGGGGGGGGGSSGGGGGGDSGGDTGSSGGTGSAAGGGYGGGGGGGGGSSSGGGGGGDSGGSLSGSSGGTGSAAGGGYGGGPSGGSSGGSSSGGSSGGSGGSSGGSSGGDDVGGDGVPAGAGDSNPNTGVDASNFDSGGSDSSYGSTNPYSGDSSSGNTAQTSSSTGPGGGTTDRDDPSDSGNDAGLVDRVGDELGELQDFVTSGPDEPSVGDDEFRDALIGRDERQDRQDRTRDDNSVDSSGDLQDQITDDDRRDFNRSEPNTPGDDEFNQSQTPDDLEAELVERAANQSDGLNPADIRLERIEVGDRPDDDPAATTQLTDEQQQSIREQAAADNPVVDPGDIAITGLDEDGQVQVSGPEIDTEFGPSDDRINEQIDQTVEQLDRETPLRDISRDDVEVETDGQGNVSVSVPSGEVDVGTQTLDVEPATTGQVTETTDPIEEAQESEQSDDPIIRLQEGLETTGEGLSPTLNTVGGAIGDTAASAVPLAVAIDTAVGDDVTDRFARSAGEGAAQIANVPALAAGGIGAADFVIRGPDRELGVEDAPGGQLALATRAAVDADSLEELNKRTSELPQTRIGAIGEAAPQAAGAAARSFRENPIQTAGTATGSLVAGFGAGSVASRGLRAIPTDVSRARAFSRMDFDEFRSSTRAMTDGGRSGRAVDDGDGLLLERELTEERTRADEIEAAAQQADAPEATFTRGVAEEAVRRADVEDDPVITTLERAIDPESPDLTPDEFQSAIRTASQQRDREINDPVVQSVERAAQTDAPDLSETELFRAIQTADQQQTRQIQTQQAAAAAEEPPSAGQLEAEALIDPDGSNTVPGGVLAAGAEDPGDGGGQIAESAVVDEDPDNAGLIAEQQTETVDAGGGGSVDQQLQAEVQVDQEPMAAEIGAVSESLSGEQTTTTQTGTTAEQTAAAGQDQAAAEDVSVGRGLQTGLQTGLTTTITTTPPAPPAPPRPPRTPRTPEEPPEEPINDLTDDVDVVGEMESPLVEDDRPLAFGWFSETATAFATGAFGTRELAEGATTDGFGGELPTATIADPNQGDTPAVEAVGDLLFADFDSGSDGDGGDDGGFPDL